jgi:hypothetical protein
MKCLLKKYESRSTNHEYYKKPPRKLEGFKLPCTLVQTIELDHVVHD